MIDTLSIISTSGVVLWQQSSHETGRRAMVNRLVQDVLLEDRAGLSHYVIDDCQLRWALEYDAKLFVVAVHPKFLKPVYIQKFLRDVASTFAAKYGTYTAKQDFFRVMQSGGGGEGPDRLFPFSAKYKVMLAKFASSEEAASLNGTTPAEESEEEEDHGETAHPDESEDAVEQEEEEGGASTGPAAQSRRKVIITKDGRRVTIGGEAAAESTIPPAKKKRGKKPTKWDEGVYDPVVEQQRKQKAPTKEELEAQASVQRATYIKRLPNGTVAPVKEKEWEGQQRGRLESWLRSYVGSRTVEEGDLQKMIPGLREKLIGKNVAVKVADHVCGSVETSLKGKKLNTFDSLFRTVESAMMEALRRILQPKREVNILRDVAAAKAAKKPFSIVFCGVNGVGKSTSLAKITYWLQQSGNSVLLAAGDTFRHGAVEQLEVHGRCLGVPVFQMGYGADPSAVAGAALVQATKQHMDVVMIDTAGRMQDHESRMRALAKLIHDNQPDLILFVGEALVGNNGVDQLRKFNQCLVDFAPVGARSRGIDGIVLTKFDTIDDKVGAALSMVYELGQPIVFVGVGQTYQDLKVIEPEVVVSALMK